MVFTAEPWPKFATFSATGVRGVRSDQFERVFLRALETDTPVTEKERVAFEMYHASFFQPAIDAKFILRVIAVEALLELRSRPDVVIKHVDSLISTTKAESTLPQTEKESLLSSLDFLRRESIRQAGIHIAETRLAGRTYLDRKPGKFFSECYNVRSNMVHGLLPFPTRDEIARLASGLELFVADLLSGPLLHIA